MNTPAAPFRLDLTAWALRRRTHNTIDRFDAGTYRRALPLGHGAVALSVTQRGSRDAPRLMVALTGANVDERAEAAARVALDRLLGLSVDLSGFAAMAAADPLIDRLAGRLRGLKPPRFPTVFEALVNAVACQQLSLTVGIHLLNRLTAAHGGPVADEPDALRAFPSPQQLASTAPAELRPLGFSASKARTIVEASRAIVDGTLELEALGGLDDAEAVARLTRVRGLGRWSASDRRPYAGVVHLLRENETERLPDRRRAGLGLRGHRHDLEANGLATAPLLLGASEELKKENLGRLTEAPPSPPTWR